MSIADRVVTTIAEQFGVEKSVALQSQDLRADFGVDSLDEIELVMALEDEFEIVIEDEAAERWKSTADVIAAITGATI